MPVDPPFRKALISRASWDPMSRKGKPKFFIFIYSFENKLLAFLEWKRSNIVNMAPTDQLVFSKIGAKIASSCWYLLLTIWTFLPWLKVDQLVRANAVGQIASTSAISTMLFMCLM